MRISKPPRQWVYRAAMTSVAAALVLGMTLPANAQPTDSGSSGSLGGLSSGSLGSGSGGGSDEQSEYPLIGADDPTDWAPANLENKIIPKADTVVAEPGDVVSVSGEFGEIQTVLYFSSDRHPSVGGFFAVNSGPGVPNGTVGKVVSVEAADGGMLRVALEAATITDAYAVFQINTTVRLEDNVLYVPGEGEAQSRSAGPRTGFPLSNKLISCKNDSGVELAVNGSIGNLSAAVQFDANAKYSRVTISSSQSLDVSLTGSGSAKCEKAPVGMTPEAIIPVGGPFSVKVGPAMSLAAKFEVKAELGYQAERTDGVEFSDGRARPVSSSRTTYSDVEGLSGSAKAEFFAGASASLGLHSKVANAGVAVEGGPNLTASLSSAKPTCAELELAAAVKGSLQANLLFASWKAELTLGKYGISVLGPYCPSDPANPGTTPAPTPTPEPELPPETRPGALTNLQIGTNLDCRVDSPTDNRSVYYGSTSCGSHLAVDGQTFGYVGSSFIPAGAQSSTGAGTALSPTVITSAVVAGQSGLELKQVDTFIDGSDNYLTSLAVTNTGSAAKQVTLYRAADCYLSNSDFGTGAVTDRSASCVSANGRQISWTDLSGGASFQEAFYSTIWNVVRTGQPFNGTARTDNHDNGAGLSWTFTVEPGQTVTRKSRFSLLEPATVAQSRNVAPVEPERDKPLLSQE